MVSGRVPVDAPRMGVGVRVSAMDCRVGLRPPRNDEGGLFSIRAPLSAAAGVLRLAKALGAGHMSGSGRV